MSLKNIKKQLINLEVDQGCTFSYTLNFEDIHSNSLTISDGSFSGFFSKHYESTAKSGDFVCTSNTTSITISLTSNTSSQIKGGKYVYSVNYQSDIGTSTIERVMDGVLTVFPQAVKD